MQICEECIRRYGGIPSGFEQGIRCDICHNIFEKIDDIVSLFKQETETIEFSTFLIGTTFPDDITILDQEIISSQFPQGKNLKHHLNSMIGRRIEEGSEKIVDFKNPELIFRLDTTDFSTHVDIKPLYVAGRYLKLRRGIPQSPWIHSGHNDSKSVSEYIGIPMTKYFGGRDYKFFSSGREDVDVLMLGNGRPFYVEVIRPVKRNGNLDIITQTIERESQGGVVVRGLHIASKEEIEQMKEETHDKLYEVSIILEEDIINFQEKVEGIKDLDILQRTPERVLRSRADMVRKKRIYSIEVQEYKFPKATIKIKSSSGTYIKEFIHGDGGRTTPSLSSILGVNIKIEYLNVLEVD